MNEQGSMFDLWAVHKTSFISVQKSPNLLRTFRTRGRQTSFLGALHDQTTSIAA